MERVDAARLTAALIGFLRTARLATQHDGVRALAGTQTGILHRVADGDRRLSDLAHELLVDTSVVSRAVAEVVRAGYVTRVTDPTDARACRLRLTEDGRTELARRTAATEQLVERTFAELGPAELDEAVAVLNRLRGLLHHLPYVRGGTEPARACPTTSPTLEPSA